VESEENSKGMPFKIEKVEKKLEENSQNPFDKLKGILDQKSTINTVSTNFLSNSSSPFLGANSIELNQNQIILPNTIYSKNLNSLDPQKNNIINIIYIYRNEEDISKNKNTTPLTNEKPTSQNINDPNINNNNKLNLNISNNSIMNSLIYLNKQNLINNSSNQNFNSINNIINNNNNTINTNPNINNCLNNAYNNASNNSNENYCNIDDFLF